MSEEKKDNDYRVDPRHTARAIALLQLFNFFAAERIAGTELSAFTVPELMDIYHQVECDEGMYERIVTGVKDNRTNIDKVITILAPAWPIDQISLIDLVILRMGVWEAFISDLVPEKVAIDEAIELAKEFTGETSAKFVNGVLGNLLKNDELKATLIQQ